MTFLRTFGLSALAELPELPNTSQEDGQITLEMQSTLERLRQEQAQVEAELEQLS